jgi:hypothetical protein
MPFWTWTTEDEIKFLRSIAAGRGSTQQARAGPRRTIEGYLKGARLRSRWEAMSSQRVILVAEELLRVLCAKEAE